MMKTYYFFLLFLLFLNSCDLFDWIRNKDNSKEKKFERYYYEDGSLQQVIPIKNGKKHGISKKYDRDGNLMSKIEYAYNKRNGNTYHYYTSGEVYAKITYSFDLKHGEAKYFFKNGKPFEITPFKKGKIHGIQKKYRRDGDKLAEIPYKNGFVGKGTKEYSKGGHRINDYPSITIKEINQVELNDKFILELSLSNNSKKVTFYTGELDEGKYLHDFMHEIYTRNGSATKEFYIPKRRVVMKTIKFFALYETRLKNKIILEKEYNLAIQH